MNNEKFILSKSNYLNFNLKNKLHKSSNLNVVSNAFIDFGKIQFNNL